MGISSLAGDIHRYNILLFPLLLRSLRQNSQDVFPRKSYLVGVTPSPEAGARHRPARAGPASPIGCQQSSPGCALPADGSPGSRAEGPSPAQTPRSRLTQTAAPGWALAPADSWRATAPAAASPCVCRPAHAGARGDERAGTAAGLDSPRS